jgi:predicted small lipoprotein YifL/copper chaperone CopZ
VKRRTLIPLALLVLAALTLTACGGGGPSDEDKITETIEKAATTNDPSNCTELETPSFVEQNGQVKGKQAIKVCEEEAKAGKDKAKSVTVSDVSVNDAKATATVKFEGGSLGSQALEFALIEDEGNWKIDKIEGFADYDGKALGEAFQKQFEEAPGELSPEQAKCISGKVAEATQAEAEELFLSGSPEKIIELAQGCA